MAANEEVGRASARPWPLGAAQGGLKSALPLAVLAAGGIVAVWFFPLFHVVPLRENRTVVATSATSATFDPAAFAEKFWRERLAPAALRATPAAAVLAALRRDPAAAAKQHARDVGLGGTAYYFVHGAGRVVSVGTNEIVVAVDGADGTQLALRTGPLFGNTVRDGTGLLNVNDFPGLAEFNALSAELNRLVETRVLPALRARAVVGAPLEFAGCAGVGEPAGGGPLLSLVPVSLGETQ